MKQYIAIVKWEGNKVSKYQDFDTKTEANTHVAKYGGFVALNPGGGTDYWTVNPVAKTVIFNQAKCKAEEEAKAWEKIRRKRNQLLQESDWTQFPDSPLTDEQKTAWNNYRQKLRDIPQDFKDPEKVEWPKNLE
tara:strand:- start:565 stop:966 length:402 start_codon:yes stop_codon:yes gene_type:complete